MEFLSLRCRPPSFQNILATRSEGRADFAGYSEADPGFLNLYSVWKGIEIGRFVNFSKGGVATPSILLLNPSHPWFLEGPEAWKWVWKMAWFGLKQSDLEPGRTPPPRISPGRKTLPSESPDPPHLFWGAWINQHFNLVGWQSEMTWLWFQRVRRRGFITYNRILD